MIVEFEFKGLKLQADVRMTSPAIPARMTGHPDTWSEGEQAEIEIKFLWCVAKIRESFKTTFNAMFLLDSDLAHDIEIAACDAAEKHAKASRARELIYDFD